MRTQRVIASIVGACVVVGLFVLSASVAVFGLLRGSGLTLLLAAVVIVVYASAIGPWHRRWGATEDEVRRRMPGDELLPTDSASTTRAITIEATPADVFPWLLQIGYGRGGWYSYDWIDNDGEPSLERIDPALQRLAVGDRIEMLPGVGPVVKRIDPDHYVLSGGDADSWCLLVEPAGEGRARLISRWRQDWAKGLGTYAWLVITDPGSFLMEQRMLRRLRDVAARRTPRREGATT